MSDHWHRVEDIFHRALELAPADRPAFLVEACGGDQSLRREVESLLAHDNEAGSTFTRVHEDEAPPQTIAHYRICGKLGEGGMGVVYRATDTKLEREVAIKVLPRSFTNDPDRKARFTREAQMLASLNHPAICTVHGFEDLGGQQAIIMELVDGETLAERLSKSPLPLAQSQMLAAQIADALAAAHGRGVVHRDLKPANIMLTKSGIKILDFGLATLDSAVPLGTKAETITQEGAMVGTLHYMSPEQVRGFPVNHRTDLFSLGVVLYEMVTGKRPFTGNSAMAVCDAILHAPPRGFGDSGVPGKVKSFIGKLLEKDPANRYADAGEVQRELKRLQPSHVRLSRKTWIGIGAVAVLACILAGWRLRGASRERWALETASPEIGRLIDAGESVKAAALAKEARTVLPKDPTLEKLWMRATGDVTIDSVPTGADVSFRPYRGDPNAWETLGRTPLTKVRVPINAYVWRFISPGFAPAVLISTINGKRPPGFRGAFNWTAKLRPEETIPSEMIFVEGDRTGLAYPLYTSAGSCCRRLPH